MSQHYYADGAKHIDHHREINIGGNVSSDGLERLLRGFFADEDAEEASFEEIDAETPDTKEDSPSYAQFNTIFNTRIFLREEHYARLRECILSFVKTGEDGTDDTFRIDATAQNEWYYIMKGIKEADVVSRSSFSVTKFVEQMVAWFPDLFVQKEDEDEDKMVRRYMSSISREGNKWITGLEKCEVPIKDMFAHGKTRGYEQAQILRMHAVADGLKKALVKLKAEIDKEKGK